MRSFKNISEIDFENPENKEIVSIERFCLETIKALSETKYFYNEILMGAMDAVSHKKQIKCKETYEEVFIFVSEKLRKLGW